jgi:hypothetical protein
LLNEFGDLPIVILLFQNCLFIFELDSNCIFFLPPEADMHSLLVLSVKNQKKKKKRIASCTLSTASAERSFSQLSRIKSYCRSTMKQNRLNKLAAAYIHKDHVGYLRSGFEYFLNGFAH